MDKEKIKLLKEKIKRVSPNFQDGVLISDAAFLSLPDLLAEKIEFGCRINALRGILIGLKDKFIFVEKAAFLVLKGSFSSIEYEQITDINIKSKLTCDKVKLILGRKELSFETEKGDTEYIVRSMKQKMSKPTLQDIHQININNFSLDIDLKNIKFDIIGRNFEKDFKLVSSKNELYLKRSHNAETEKIQIIGNIADITQVTEENKSSLLKKAGWGILAGTVGGIVAAPLAVAGFLSGILAKGQKKEIVFACELKTGEKFLAKADNNTYQKLLACSML